MRGRNLPEHDDPAGDTATVRAREVPQGAMEVGDDPALELVATLGSCVSVALHAPGAGIGGMNHIYQNVHDRPGGELGVVSEMERLVNAFMQRGLPRAALTARVAGGAHVLPQGRDYGIAIAGACLAYLEREAIPVVGVSVGGASARRMRFHPVSGRVQVRLLATTRDLELPPPGMKGNPPEMF
jgi:chemotaxis protein CheD